MAPTSASRCQGEQHLFLRALEPTVYPGRRRSTSILQVGGVYIGFKCHKTLRWQALWDVIKRKYDWSAVEQWRRCLWDGLWLCQELAAKSIDPDAIAVCTTNTQGFMYLSRLEAADDLSKLTYSSLKWNVSLFAPSHFLIFMSLDSVWAFWHKELVTRSFSSWMSHLLKWRMHQWRKQTLNVCWCCSGVHPWPGSLAAPVQFEQNFNNAVCSPLSDDFGGPWAKQRRTQNSSMAHIFITLSWGQLGYLLFLFFSFAHFKMCVWQKKTKDNLMLSGKKNQKLQGLTSAPYVVYWIENSVLTAFLIILAIIDGDDEILLIKLIAEIRGCCDVAIVVMLFLLLDSGAAASPCPQMSAQATFLKLLY